MARILIVDDDPDQLGICSELLRRAGHEVAVAWNGPGVLRQTAWAELILMDLRMPDAAHGMALIRRIRESGYGGPVMVVSGWPDEIYGQPEERMVSRVMIKPVPVPELLRTIAALVSAA